MLGFVIMGNFTLMTQSGTSGGTRPGTAGGRGVGEASAAQEAEVGRRG